MTKRSMQEESVRDLGMGCSGGMACEGGRRRSAYLEDYGMGCSGFKVKGTFLAKRISSGLPPPIDSDRL